MSVLSECISVHMCTWYLWRPEENISSTVQDLQMAELPCEDWELNPSPLKKQLVFLTTEHLSGLASFLVTVLCRQLTDV